jgi:uridine phosphorylase
MGLVYRFAAGCVVGIIAERVESEVPDLARKDAAVDHAIGVAVAAADRWSQRPAA